MDYNKSSTKRNTGEPGVLSAVIATRCRVEDRLAESREVLTRPRVSPRVSVRSSRYWTNRR